MSSKVEFVIDTAAAATGTFTVDSTTTTLNVQHGQNTQMSVTLNGTPSDATISVACVNLPMGVAGSYNNGVATFTTSASTPAGSYPVVVIFTTTLQTTAMVHHRALLAAGFGFMSLPLGLLWMGGRRKSLRAGLITVIGLVLLWALAGCGGGGNSSQTTTPSTQSSIPLNLIVS